MTRGSQLAVCVLLASVLTIGAVYATDVFDPGGPLAIITGTPKFTGLTASTALHLNSAQVLTADTLLNGQLLCGATGGAPAICTPAAGTSLAVTLGAGAISYDAIQDIRTTAAPTFASLTLTKALTVGLVNPAYQATVAIDAAQGNLFRITATNNVGFTVSNPTNAATGKVLTVMVRNTSGGALGVLTWDTLYKLGAAWSQPATGFSRSINFEYDGANWVETTRGAADVAN